MRIFLLSIIMISSVFAHRLYILADDDGKNLHVKAYYTKSSFCQNCEVNALDKDGKVIASGKTDEKGEATLPFKTKNMDIEVIASMGHKNKVSYESENDPLTEDKNLDYKKILLAFGILFGIFFLLKVFKKR